MFFTNQLEIQRLEKADTLKAMGKNPYTHYTARDINAAEFKKKFAYINDLEEKKDDKTVLTLIGRVKFLRWMGKAVFAKIEDESSEALQIYFNKEGLGDEWFEQIKKLLDIGDIIQTKGYPFVTKTGELSLHVITL
ncbi:MAG: lysine--tRNA ligase, partial [Campylobacteraceae bacterium]|nr:lysine--tRNA ligase [Campylobacteraceae bacterium]